MGRETVNWRLKNDLFAVKTLLGKRVTACDIWCMEFLFHTTVEWNGQLAFYTIFILEPNRYFAKVHEPFRCGAADFGFWLDSQGNWQCGRGVPPRHIQV